MRVEPIHFKRRILLTTCIVAIVGIAGGFGVGFNCGMYYQKISTLHPKKCTEYTVLDADRVITSCGDTIKYNWQPLKRKDDGSN
jgi:hypothetical protein